MLFFCLEFLGLFFSSYYGTLFTLLRLLDSTLVSAFVSALLHHGALPFVFHSSYSDIERLRTVRILILPPSKFFYILFCFAFCDQYSHNYCNLNQNYL